MANMGLKQNSTSGLVWRKIFVEVDTESNEFVNKQASFETN